jgi:uncharacterized protein (DUF39 family)
VSYPAVAVPIATADGQATGVLLVDSSDIPTPVLESVLKRAEEETNAATSVSSKSSSVLAASVASATCQSLPKRPLLVQVNHDRASKGNGDQRVAPARVEVFWGCPHSTCSLK